MNSQNVSFSNEQGQTLAARLDLPIDGAPKAVAIFAHCFTCSKNLKAVTHISRALTLRQIAVLRFDFTGLGESEGDFAETNFSSNVADLICAANYLTTAFQPPHILIGHSLGGAAVLQAAASIPSVKAVVTIGAPCNPGHVTQLLESARDEIEASGEAQVNLAGRSFRIKKQFLDDLDSATMRDKIGNLKKALLVLHSPLDNTVGIENAADIFKSARHPKSFVTLDTADHLLSDESDSRYAGALIAAWVNRYLDADITPPVKSSLPREANVTIVQTGSDRYYTEIMANGHALVSDEPLSVGGTNQGASPYALLSAALGACTTITMRMYADRKEWPMTAVSVRIEHDKIPAADCDGCETKTGKVDIFRRELTIEGPLDEAQRQRLLEIADRCPVHRSLHSEIKVETRLLD